MKVLVVGGGGREHALAWGLARSGKLERLFAAPGNGGTGLVAENVAIAADDIDALADFAVSEGIDLTVVGPEAPLVAGIGDRFAKQGLRCFGPSRAAARLEGSKVFAKEFMKKNRIPTADFAVFDEAGPARRWVEDRGAPIVIKADGLAAGKGVIVAGSVDEALHALDDIMVRHRFGDSGSSVVIEECLAGEEVSVHAICDGHRSVLLPPSQDHKRARDNDEGPNTGGMGAYAPVPFVGANERERVERTIIEPTLRGMREEGHLFRGVLYAGLMMTEEGPKVLEFNVRFGDPETQVLVPLLDHDLLDLLYNAAEGRLPERVGLHEERCAASVVMASGGYPGSYRKGCAIHGLDTVDGERRVAFHAGTKRSNGGFVTTGGRVLAVTAWGDDHASAIRHAYEGVERVEFDDAFWRKDIGRKAL